MKCFGPFLHRWSKWESYRTNLTRYVSGNTLTGIETRYDPPLQISETWEKRSCGSCGATQHRKIRNF